MRKLIMWNMVTLDGLFEGPNKWDIDWHNIVWGDELEQLSIEQSKSVGMLLFGRVTYEGMAGCLFDEYRLGLTPVVLGAGTPLFKPNSERVRMKLLETRPLKSGCVILRYESDRQQAG